MANEIESFIDTFLKLKTEKELFMYRHYRYNYRGYVDFCYYILGSILDNDLPLYVNHPCGLFRELVTWRLKGGAV